MQSFEAVPATPHYTGRIHPALTQLCRRNLRHAGASDRLCLHAGAALHPGRPSLGPTAADPLDAEPAGRRAGRWPPAQSRPLPPASSICHTKQDLIKSSGIPRAAARTSCAGSASPTQAGGRARNLPAGRRVRATAGGGGSRLPHVAVGLPAVEAAGMIDSKFGAVTLLRPDRRRRHAPASVSSRRSTSRNCASPACPARARRCLPARAAIACMLNRLTLLAAGNDAKLAELFARAELKRGDCRRPPTGALGGLGDRHGNPRLRGAFCAFRPSRWFSCNFHAPRALLSSGVAQLT